MPPSAPSIPSGSPNRPRCGSAWNISSGAWERPAVERSGPGPPGSAVVRHNLFLPGRSGWTRIGPMLQHLADLLPQDAYQLAFVLFLSFLIGLEREEVKRGGKTVFGGVRTFPLLGLLGYVVSLLARDQPMGVLIGLLVVGALMALSYWHKLQTTTEPGITTEVTGLLVYLMGALVHMGFLWFASALAVTSLLLLEFKQGLEGL